MSTTTAYRVEYYGPGDAARGPFSPGDLILTHGEGWASALIRFGQRLRFRGTDRPYAHYNHAALRRAWARVGMQHGRTGS